MRHAPSLIDLERSIAGSREPLGFLSLPYEIREMIYKHLLVSDEWIIVERKQDVESSGGGEKKLHCYKLPKMWVCGPDRGWSSQFLRVSQLAHAEGTPFLYGHNKFEVCLKTLLETWLPAIGQRNAAYVRYMELAQTRLGRFKATYTLPTLLLGSFPGLRSLYFTPVVEGNCSDAECRFFCRHTPSALKIQVLRFAHLVSTAHPHLRWLFESEVVSHRYRSGVRKWYELSDDETDRHPARPHEHPDYLHQISNPRPRLTGTEVLSDVVDIEEQLTRIKVVKVRTGRIVHRGPGPVSGRSACRV